jgi:YidC/Oxa1 family membrane protein insertase
MFEKRYSTVYYKPTDDGTDYCSCTGDDLDDLQSQYVSWVSHAHQFFNTSLMSGEQPFSGGIFSTVMLEEDEERLKTAGTSLGIPYNHSANESIAMTMYIGPNEYSNLIAYNNDLEEIIPFGNSIFGDINRHGIRPAFDFLSKYIGSKGVVILVLIFILKMLLYPLYYKMLYSQAKMGALKPELAGLKNKFKDDAQKVQMETMKIYREYGVSPLGGCMPMVIQIPIWYALFRFFPASITFRQEKFLWANDLSSYDAFLNLPFTIPMFGSHLSLFTILWAVSTVLYTYYNMKHMDMSSNPAMKYVQYLMPLMFFVYFNNYASGLTCYMFLSNLMNIMQTVVTKNFIFDDDKIRAELEKQKEKPKKRSKFQQRLEDAMKQQQLNQQKRQKKK